MRQAMFNRNVLIAGEPGSGKTQLARSLFLRSPRAIVIDPLGEYEGIGKITSTLRDAAYFISERREEDYRLVFRPEFDPLSETDAFVRFIHSMQLRYDLPAIAIGLEEATTYGETHSLPPAIKDAYTKGRHARLNIVTVIQLDTDIHRTVRACSQIVIAMKQHRLSSEMAKMFYAHETSELTELKPGMTPTKGKHFLTYPRDVDLYGSWDAALAQGL